MIGTVVGNFCIVSPLGKGGMGEVWLAEQQSIKTKVAIKLLNADISADHHHVQRFFNEAVAVSKIRHAGIVKIFDVGFVGQQAYLAMEYLEGESLAGRIVRRRRLSLAEVCDVGRQVAGVLDATHAAGITHRDLKPDNIFLVPDAELPSGERAKVLDFGIAKLGSVGMTSTSVSSMGTPLYMSPEQWRSVAKVDNRADAYSLGCVVFEMACGRPPFLADSIGEACAKHLTDAPPLPGSLVPGIPPAFDQLVARLLEKDPALRPTLKETVAALGAIAQMLPAAPPPGAYAASPPLPTGPVPMGAVTVGTYDGSRPIAVPSPTGFGPHGSTGHQPMAPKGTGQPMGQPMATGQPMGQPMATGQPMGQPMATGQPMMPPVTTLGGSAGSSGVAPQAGSRRGKRAGWLIAGGVVVAAAGATAIVLASRGSEPASPSAAGSQAAATQQPPQSPAQPPPPPEQPPPSPPAPPPPAHVDAPLVSPNAVRLVSGEPLKALRSPVTAQLCIDPAGAVTDVEVGLDVDSKLAAEVKAKLATWRYAPFKRDGAAIAVCFPATLRAAPPVVAGGGSTPGGGSGGGSIPGGGSGGGSIPGGGSGKPPPKPPKPPKPPEPPLPEQLTRAAFAAGIAKVKSRVVACAVNNSGHGILRIEVRVAPGGHVQSTRVLRAPGPAMADCASRAVQAAVFQKTAEGGTFTVPFVL